MRRYRPVVIELSRISDDARPLIPTTGRLSQVELNSLRVGWRLDSCKDIRYCSRLTLRQDIHGDDESATRKVEHLHYLEIVRVIAHTVPVRVDSLGWIKWELIITIGNAVIVIIVVTDVTLTIGIEIQLI